MSETTYRKATVRACNVKPGDIVIRVGKKVKQVKPKANGTVRLKVERLRKDIVLDDDRLVRVNRPTPKRPPTPKQHRKATWKRVFEEERERNIQKVGKIIAARYPKRELLAV